MKLPIRILRGRHAGYLRGYEQVYYGYKREDFQRVPGSEVSVHVADWLYGIITLPERIWRYILCRLWLDRLTFQYERGYTEGLRDAYYNPEQFRTLEFEEKAALFGLTREQVRQLEECMKHHWQERRTQLLAEFTKENQ